jgi:uncharacterized protein involved in cysteine biosynthesis
VVNAFFLSLAQLRDPRILKVLAKSLLLTLLIFAAAAALAGWLLTGANPCGWGPLSGDCTIGGGAGTALALVLGFLSLWFLFPAVAMGVMGIFSDDVVDAVEERHFPAAAASARRPTAAQGLALGVRSAARILWWNLLALPFYILLLVTGIGPFILFFAVNALALGRDLGEMVAVRHHRDAELKRWLAATRGRRALLGLFTAFLFVVPFANLLAPVLGAAMATHLFQGDAR